MKKNIDSRIIKIISFFLLFVMTAQLFYGCQFRGDDTFSLPSRILKNADEVLSFGSYSYMVYDDDTIILTEYRGTESSVIIPNEIEGKKVVELAALLFVSNDYLTSIIIGDNIEIIGNYAFFCCIELTQVSMGKNVWYIGAAAFDETPWYTSQTDEYVIVGDGVLVKYNGDSKSITFPDSIKHLSTAFYGNTNIVSVILSDELLTIGDYAFANCENLSYIKLSNNLLYIGNYAFEKCLLLSLLDVPDKCEEIGDYAYNACYSLSTVHIGNSVNSIGKYAFNSCFRISSFSLPVSLTTVGLYAFYGCTAVIVIFYSGDETQFQNLNLDETNYVLRDSPKIYGITGGGHETEK